MFWYPKQRDYDLCDDNGVTLRDFLKSYDPNRYDRPAVTVDNLIFKRSDEGLKILLIRRGRHPYYGMLGLPGGFIEMGESLEDAAARELYEETGVFGVPLTQLGAYGAVGRDPRLRIISIAYFSITSNDISCRAGDDASEAEFFLVSSMKSMNNLETIHELCFSNGSDKATCRILEKGGKRSIVDSRMASDHGIMVLDALERLACNENK